MRFAIIAAGEGSRLSGEGIKLPKPLVPLNGVPMIDRLIRIFIRNGATSVAIIINEEQILTKEHLLTLKTEVPLDIVVKSTPSSMHSFFELSSLLQGEPFCLTTVDTIFKEEDFSAYIKAFQQSGEDGLMAVTDYVDDEKPLYVSTDDSLAITGFYDEATQGSNYISGGIYCLKSTSLNVLKDCIGRGISRMRNFQRQLVADGLSLKAYPFSKIIDVDHAEDIAKAEAFISER
ncbi:MAG: NDP-sugar synthase [Bacteroidaceae bacterium]